MAKVTLDQWIQEALNDTTRDGPCSLVTCVHKEGNNEREVYSIKVEPGQKWDVLELAKIFQRRADMHVQGVAGHQQFFMRAHYAGRVEWQAQLPFQVVGISEVAYGTSEPPTDEGKRMQNMRWGEGGYQFFFTQAMNLARLQNDLIGTLAQDRFKLVNENMDMVNVFKEMIMEKAADQHKYQMELMKFQRESKMFGELAKLGPPMLNALTGKEIIPQNVADSALIEAMLDTMSEEDVQKIGTMSIPQSVKALLAARATEHFKKKREAEAMAVNAVKDREDDTTKLDS